MATKQKVKTKDFQRRLEQAKANGITLIVIQAPEELGETYEEMIDSLNCLAAMDMNMAVLPRRCGENKQMLSQPSNNIYLYPVKSMRGVPVEEAHFRCMGFWGTGALRLCRRRSRRRIRFRG